MTDEKKPTGKMEDKPILPVAASWNFTMTDGQVAEIKKAFVDAPAGKLTVEEWVEFTQRHAPKRVCDPRRARPI